MKDLQNEPAQTQSEGNTDTEASADIESLTRSESTLLGDELRRSEQLTFVLVKVASGNLEKPAAEALQKNLWMEGRETLLNKGKPPLVVGPLSFEQARSFFEKKIFKPQDTVQRSFDRWRAPQQVFPELGLDSAFSHVEEITDTATASVGVEGGFSRDEGSTVSREIELNLEMMPDSARERKEEVSDPLLEKLRAPGKPDAVVLPLEIPRIREKSVGGATQGSPQRPSSFAKARNWDAVTWTGIISVALIFIVVGVGYGTGFFEKVGQEESRENEDSSQLSKAVETDAQNVEVPEDLRPRTFDSIYAEDDWLLAKLRPVLMALERGSLVLTSDQEKLLRSYAAAGTSSWEARRIAANVLAIFELSRGRLPQAKSVLNPVFEADPSDPATLVNRGLIALLEKNEAEARDLIDAATRLSPRGSGWIPHVVAGQVELTSPARLGASMRSFDTARENSPNNPFVEGIRIEALSKAGPEAQARIPQALREALWLDFSRLEDSPVRAPFPGTLIANQALEGFRKGVEGPGGTQLKPGQRAYFRWIENKMRGNPLAQDTQNLVRLLRSEEELLSRFLMAQVELDRGQTEEALTILGRLQPLLESSSEIPSSFPWSLKGDIEFSLGRIDASLLSYEKALRRNRNDVAAVWGIALVLRSKGDYVGARQKLTESLALDPYFVPALLRISRLEWQKKISAP